jgi:hypothetical protein
LTSAEEEAFVARVGLCAAICSGEPAAADLWAMVNGSRNAPLYAARFLLQLCRAAEDLTVDRAAAVARTLKGAKPSASDLPRLKGRALLVVEVAAASELKARPKPAARSSSARSSKFG